MKNTINIVAFFLGLLIAVIPLHANADTCVTNVDTELNSDGYSVSNIYTKWAVGSTIYVEGNGIRTIIGVSSSNPFGSYPFSLGLYYDGGSWIKVNYRTSTDTTLGATIQFSATLPDQTTDICGTAPESWTNGIKDPDEDGIDCGGVTDTACVNTCPGDMVNHIVDLSDAQDGSETASVCSYDMPTNSLGDCPSGWATLDSSSSSTCIEISSIELPLLASPDYINNETPSVTDPNPWNELDTTTTKTIERSTVTDPDGTEHSIVTTATTKTASDGTSSTENVTVDTAIHPDGSKTVTTTTTGTTDGAGGSDSTGTSSTLTQEYDADGNLVSETEEKSEEAADDNLGGLPVVVDAQEGLNFGPLIAAKDTGLQRFPISLVNSIGTYIGEWVVSPVAPSWTLTFPNPVGSNWQFDIDLHMMDPYVEILRTMLKVLFVVSFTFLIIRRWTS